jgi:hypothetical protein
VVHPLYRIFCHLGGLSSPVTTVVCGGSDFLSYRILFFDDHYFSAKLCALGPVPGGATNGRRMAEVGHSQVAGRFAGNGLVLQV